jgi:hypothetical protein
MAEDKLEKMPREHPEAKTRNLTCGSCQWINSGFENKTCSNSRGVGVSTTACVEYTEVYEDRFYDIARDKWILDLRKRLKQNKFKISDSLINEIDGYIVDFDYTNFQFGSKQDLEATAKTLLKIVSFRARISTIYTSALDIKSELDEVIHYANLWIQSKHFGVMKELRNEEARQAALHRVLPEVIPIQTKLSKILQKSKLLDDKLNANEWTLRSVLETASRLVYSKEGTQRVGAYGV